MDEVELKIIKKYVLCDLREFRGEIKMCSENSISSNFALFDFKDGWSRASKFSWQIARSQN
jgi:hypothetical protein